MNINLNLANSMSPESHEAFALEVVKRLRARNFTAFFAGGCVRDRLLGRTAKDFDVATSAKPGEVRNVFGRRRTLALGASFGVITVLGPKSMQVEVATFRSDGHYTDGRHPDDVCFRSAREDAARRDFTINGMFYDPIEMQVIDYVGGEADLQSGIVRAIGEPIARITEDRLRMLRAIRFAAAYDFHIEPTTMGAIQSQAVHLSVVSQERITGELLRMLAHPSRSRALELLHASQLLPIVLEPFTVGMNESRWTRLLSLLASKFIESETVALAAILGKEGLELERKRVYSICGDLKLSNEQRTVVCWICEHEHLLQDAPNQKRSQLQPLLIQSAAPLALTLMQAAAEIDHRGEEAILACQEFLSRPLTARDPAPLIRGEDLMQVGMQPGPAFARILKAVRSAQLDGEIGSAEEALVLAQRLNASDESP